MCMLASQQQRENTGTDENAQLANTAAVEKARLVLLIVVLRLLHAAPRLKGRPLVVVHGKGLFEPPKRALLLLGAALARARVAPRGQAVVVVSRRAHDAHSAKLRRLVAVKGRTVCRHLAWRHGGRRSLLERRVRRGLHGPVEVVLRARRRDERRALGGRCSHSLRLHDTRRLRLGALAARLVIAGAAGDSR